MIIEYPFDLMPKIRYITSLIVLFRKREHNLIYLVIIDQNTASPLQGAILFYGLQISHHLAFARALGFRSCLL